MNRRARRSGRMSEELQAFRTAPPEAIETATQERAIIAGEVELPTDPDAPTPRRRRASTGGLHKKLDTPEPPEGFMYRWFNDVPGRLAIAEDLAYDPVTDPNIRSDNPGGPVRRVVGTHPNGQPLHAYLMKTPVTEWQRGQAEREETHRLVDKAINEGQDATGRVQDAYGEGSIRAR